MTGASGIIRVSGQDSAMSYITVNLVVEWTQEYTPGSNYSDVVISARITRTVSPAGTLGGTWFITPAGSIKVNGTPAISWTEYGISAAWATPGTVGWQATGTVRVEHTKSVDVVIDIPKMVWVNTSYGNATFTIPVKTETVTLDAVEALGTARIGNVTYDIYIGGSGKYERYRAYVGAADGSEWLPMS